jgi:predicted kinase
MEAVIFIGIQGSGKSSFFKERFFDTHVRISLDMLRTRNRERLLLEACLEAKQKFVIDNTNPTSAERAQYIEKAKAHYFPVTGYYFRATLKDAISRNAQREGKSKIPEKGLLGTFKRLEIPRMDEGFSALFYVWIDENGRFVLEDWKDEV